MITGSRGGGSGRFALMPYPPEEEGEENENVGVCFSVKGESGSCFSVKTTKRECFFIRPREEDEEAPIDIPHIIEFPQDTPETGYAMLVIGSDLYIMNSTSRKLYKFTVSAGLKGLGSIEWFDDSQEMDNLYAHIRSIECFSHESSNSDSILLKDYGAFAGDSFGVATFSRLMSPISNGNMDVRWNYGSGYVQKTIIYRYWEGALQYTLTEAECLETCYPHAYPDNYVRKGTNIDGTVVVNYETGYRYGFLRFPDIYQDLASAHIVKGDYVLSIGKVFLPYSDVIIASVIPPQDIDDEDPACWCKHIVPSVCANITNMYETSRVDIEGDILVWEVYDGVNYNSELYILDLSVLKDDEIDKTILHSLTGSVLNFQVHAWCLHNGALLYMDYDDEDNDPTAIHQRTLSSLL